LSLSERISLEHGSGGALSRQLTEELIYPILSNDAYRELSDATAFEISGRTFITTDTYVVEPAFFPGGDIGTLGVFGTCNDLAVCGARPLYLTIGLVLEEGYPTSDLRRVLESIRDASDQVGVRIISGDTKVVPAGKGGGIFLNTTGVGEALGEHLLSMKNIRDGDSVLVSGPVGSHGLAILASREGLKIGANLRSDCAPLFPLCQALYELGKHLRFMRDATRGGVAAVLNETVAGNSECGMEIQETAFPISGTVEAASDLLGLNPLEIANEGVMIAVVAPEAAEEALSRLHSFETGREASWVGEVSSRHPGRVILETAVGGRRILDLPRGLLLPRIC
jgi:hydrogenase expression/formation protein HypE